MKTPREVFVCRHDDVAGKAIGAFIEVYRGIDLPEESR